MRIAAFMLMLLFAALPARAEIAGKAWAIAGDTLVIDEMLVRLSGVDAPDPEQTCGPEGAAWACGDDAMKALETLVQDRDVQCTDVARISDFTVTALCTVDGEDVAAALLARGLAVNRSGADTPYGQAEAGARSDGIGMWGGPFMDPEAWRKVHDCSCTARHKAYMRDAEPSLTQ